MSRKDIGLENALKELLPKGGRILIGVSGGIDSMALLYGCIVLARLLKLHIEVAHVDHGLRLASKKDAKFVSEFCQSKSIPFHLSRPKKRNVSQNTEAWGRAVRYKFFTKLLKDKKLDWILTAHTANDAAETLLMKLVSNKEPTGILRIDSKRRCLRPLLSVTRKTIEDYARKNKIQYVEDETNSQESFLRNRVRHRLIPLLEKEFDKRIVETLAERGEALSEDILSLRETASMAAPKSINKFGTKEWKRELEKVILLFPNSIQWRIFESALAEKLKFQLGRKHSLRIRSFFLENSPRCELPGGFLLTRKDGMMRLTQKNFSK